MSITGINNVLILENNGKRAVLRFQNRESATFACQLLRKQPGIIFAMAVIDHPMDEDQTAFVFEHEMLHYRYGQMREQNKFTAELLGLLSQ